jgi:Fe-Mn family superoxide dismutase
MFTLPKLPYDYDALEPAMSADTLQFHHDKHHKTYVEKTNELATKAGLEDKSLEDVVRAASRTGEKKLFNNAAQAWNHAFFWNCMTDRASAPDGALKAAIDKAFGDQDAFADQFVEQGFSQFGSGWVWLVTGPEGLKIITTHDADDTLIKDGLFPLLVCDVWEHAYYLDYQNDRKAFLTSWIEKLANFEFAAEQLAASEGDGQGFRYPAPGGSEPKAPELDGPGPRDQYPA